MGVVLLSFLKAHIWLLSYWHFFLKKPRYGCCPVDIFKSPDMVVVMLAFFFFYILDMVVVLLTLLK